MNDISFLHPEVQEKLKTLIAGCDALGIVVKVSDTLRYENEQNEKYSMGRLSPGEISTYGQYPNNYHCWGLAFDLYTYKEEDYKTIAQIAESLDLKWGGNSESSYNLHHFEYQMESLKFLRLTYKNYNNFRLTWDPDYKPTTIGITQNMLQLINEKHKTDIENIQIACNMDGFRAKNRRTLSVTGKLDDITLEVLSNIKMKNDERYSLIKRIQILLTKVGHPVTLTGKYDTDTINAISHFKMKNNMDMSGEITKEFIIILLLKI